MYIVRLCRVWYEITRYAGAVGPLIPGFTDRGHQSHVVSYQHLYFEDGFTLRNGLRAAPLAVVLPSPKRWRVNAASSDFPDGVEGSELAVAFTVLRRKFIGLNGELIFTPNELG